MSALPNEVLVHLLSFVYAGTLIRCERASKRFHRVIRENFHRMRRFTDFKLEFSIGIATLKLSGSSAVEKAFNFNLERTDEQKYFVAADVQKLFTFLRPNVERVDIVVMDVEGIFKQLLEKFQKRFLFTNLEARLFYYDKSLKNIFLEACLPEITTVTMDDCFFASDFLPISLAQTSVTSLVFNKSVQNVDLSFFQSEAARKLKKLEREVNFFDVRWELRDQELLKLKKIEVLRLSLVRVELTLHGVREMVNQWRRGERKMKSVLLELEDDPARRDQVREALHDCDDACSPYDHPIWNLERTERLHLCATVKDDGFANDRDTWLIAIRECPKGGCSCGFWKAGH